MIVRDLEEAKQLARVIRQEASTEYFYEYFADRHSPDFDPDRHLQRVGVVNQTTMLATETQAIAELLRQAMIARYGERDIDEHFADTNDTLCYATKENQDATVALIEDGGDVAVVVGGYNSSNTSHLVELCEERMPTYFICDANEMSSARRIRHLNIHTRSVSVTTDWLPLDSKDGLPIDVVLTAGASCPDSLLDETLHKIVSWFPTARSVDFVMAAYQEALPA